MRIAALMCVVGLGGCAGIQGSPAQGENWTEYNGTWAFDGTVTQGPTRTPVSGTVHLEDGWYWLEATHGRCDAQMPMMGGPTLELACPGIRLNLRADAGSFDVVGHASVDVQELVERRVCTQAATEQAICTNVSLSEDVRRTARVEVTRSTAVVAGGSLR